MFGDFLGNLENHHRSTKFLGNFEIIWASFYSNIWQHCKHCSVTITLLKKHRDRMLQVT